MYWEFCKVHADSTLKFSNLTEAHEYSWSSMWRHKVRCGVIKMRFCQACWLTADWLFSPRLGERLSIDSRLVGC